MEQKTTVALDVQGDRIPLIVMRGTTPGVAERAALVLFLYGGSVDFTAERASPLIDLMVDIADYPVAVFNHRGSPGTVTPFSGTGLYTRIEDARAVIDYVRSVIRPPELIVWGHSMGGYIAAHLASMKPDGIVLSSPAAYDRRAVAERVNFGPEFSGILRAPDSWKRSDGPELLHDFTGRLLVIAMEHDEIVPREVPPWYVGGAKQADTMMVSLPFGHKGTFEPEGEPKRMALIGAFRRWRGDIR